MGRTGSKPSAGSSELSIYKQHRPRASGRPVPAVRLAVVPVSSAAGALHLVNAPDLEPLSDPAARAASLEARMLAILESGQREGETIDAAFRRKEHELGAVFASLSVAESRALHRRLSIPAQGDLVAARFGQLIVERRGRLLAFLADARRREAIAKSARG